MEIELYSGELKDVLKLTQVLADKYGLEAENRSKYARAMELLGPGDHDIETEWEY